MPEGASPSDDEPLAHTAHSLARGLQDRNHPTTCPDCLHIFHRTIETEDLVDIRINCHEIFQACIVIVTLRRSQDEYAALRQSLHDASLHCNRRAWHKQVTPVDCDMSLSDPLHVFITASYWVLNVAFGIGWYAPTEVRKNPKRAPGHKHGMWPTHASDLYPLGAYETAEAHVRWCCELFSPAPSMYLAHVLYLYRSTLMPHVLKSPLRERLIWCLVMMINPNALFDAGDWPGGTPPFDAPTKREVWMDPSKADYNSIHVAYNILRSITHGLEGSMTEFQRFTSGYDRVLLEAIYAGLPTIKDDSNPRKVYLARLTMDLNDNAGLSPSALHPSIYPLIAHLHGSAAINILAEVLRRRYLSRDCYGPACGKGILDSDTGRLFPRCGTCRFTQYCSRACQAADWRAPTVPHKVLCPLLERLVKIANLDHDFETEFRKTGLSVEDCEPIVSWGAVHGDLATLELP